MRYNSVVFDMDGVILDFEGDGFKWKYDAVREVLQKHDVETGDIDRAQLDAFLGDQGVNKCVELCNERGLDTRTIWTELAEATARARASQIKNGDFTLFPEVREVLETLRNEEIELGLISNAPEIAIMETVSYFDLKRFFKFFRGIEDFEDLSDRKPHPDHLEFARAELKRGPFIYAGDAESDIMAAKNAGMDSLWVNRNGRSSSDLDISPDYEAEDLKKILSIAEE